MILLKTIRAIGCAGLALLSLQIFAAQGGGTAPASGTGTGGGAPAVNPIAKDVGDRVPLVLNGKYYALKDGKGEDGVVGHLVTDAETVSVVTSNDDVLKKLAQNEGKKVALQGLLEEPEKDADKDKNADPAKEPEKPKEKKFTATRFMDGIQTTADISNPRGL